MTPIQKLIKEKGGPKAFAEWAVYVSERTAQEWNAGKRAESVGVKGFLRAHVAEEKLRVIAGIANGSEVSLALKAGHEEKGGVA